MNDAAYLLQTTPLTGADHDRRADFLARYEAAPAIRTADEEAVVEKADDAASKARTDAQAAETKKAADDAKSDAKHAGESGPGGTFTKTADKPAH